MMGPIVETRYGHPSISLIERSRLWRENDMQCMYCGRKAKDHKDATADHIIPKSMGGLHARWNLVPCCQSCNSSKRERSLKDWVSEGGYARFLLSLGLNEAGITFMVKELVNLWDETWEYHHYLLREAA